MAAILPFDDVLRFRDVNNDDTRVRSRVRSGELWGIEAVALPVLVDRLRMCSTTSNTQMGMFLCRKIAYNITARMC